MPENLSPNLLSDSGKDEDLNNYSVYINILKIFITALLGVFILLGAANFVLNTSLSGLKLEQNNLSARITSLSSEELNIRRTGLKISAYKSYLSSRKGISDKTSFVLGKIGGLQVDEFQIDPAKFSLTVVGGNAYDFTKLIFDYLSGSVVSEIRLKSASINPATDLFTVSIEGAFQ